MLSEIEIAGYRPGALAKVVGLHMAYYSTHWGFGLAFETKVAGELSEFLSRYQSDKDLFLAAYLPCGECIASISLDFLNAKNKGAHIRWFIVDAKYSGQGLGRQLMTKVTSHCDNTGVTRSYLTTFEGLHAARKLYDSFDYKLVGEQDVDQWGGGVREQLFIRDLNH